MANFVVWVDAQLSPGIARWLSEEGGVNARAVRDCGLRDAEDGAIFAAARAAGDMVVMTKDNDFVQLLERHGPPPKVLWMTCGNTSNATLSRLLAAHLSDALRLHAAGEPLVEISGP